MPILGTSVDAIDRAEDRRRFEEVCRRIGARVPANGTAVSEEEALAIAREIGFPVLVRPSYVLGGRAMEIVYDGQSLKGYFARAVKASPDHPVLIDRFLEDAFEADVDALCGRHRCRDRRHHAAHRGRGRPLGDSACVLPPYLLGREELDEMRRLTRRFALELGVVGLLNVPVRGQGRAGVRAGGEPARVADGAVRGQGDGVPLARLAARLMAGEELADLGVVSEPEVNGVAVKEAVFPFSRYRSGHAARARDALDGRGDWGWTTPSGWRLPRPRCPRATGCPRVTATCR